MTDPAGIDGRSIRVLWVEDHGLVRRVDLLTGHGERAGPAHAPCAHEKTQTRKISVKHIV